MKSQLGGKRSFQRSSSKAAPKVLHENVADGSLRPIAQPSCCMFALKVSSTLACQYICACLRALLNHSSGRPYCGSLTVGRDADLPWLQAIPNLKQPENPEGALSLQRSMQQPGDVLYVNRSCLFTFVQFKRGAGTQIGRCHFVAGNCSAAPVNHRQEPMSTGAILADRRRRASAGWHGKFTLPPRSDSPSVPGQVGGAI